MGRSWEELFLSTLTLISSGWSVLAVHQAAWEPACVGTPSCRGSLMASAFHLAPRRRENRLANARREAFNPAIGDATSLSAAGSCGPGQPGDSWDRCHHKPSSVAKCEPGQMGCCPSGTPGSQASALGILETGRAVPAAPWPHSGPCSCSHLPATLLDPLGWPEGLFLPGFVGA